MLLLSNKVDKDVISDCRSLLPEQSVERLPRSVTVYTNSHPAFLECDLGSTLAELPRASVSTRAHGRAVFMKCDNVIY